MTIRGNIIKETEKYIYTVEPVQYSEKHYFIECKPYQNNYGIWNNGGIDCTVFMSEKEAYNNLNNIAAVWRWDTSKCHVIEKVYDRVKVVKHRYMK